MATRRQLIGLLVAVLAGLTASAGAQRQAAETPAQFFGFRIGTDGELARYPKVVEYLGAPLARHEPGQASARSGRRRWAIQYVLATISAPENLARLDRLIEINRRLANPRGLSPAEATKLAQEGRAFYFLYGTIHSTEVGNTQAITEIAHRLATEDSADIKQILDNLVVLIVPSQNPDGQVLVIDHWYKTKGTPLGRTYPDLYHKYIGHDDNRDWFMFTQQETRLAVGDPERLQAEHHPRHAPEGSDRGAHLRAAVRRSVRSERPSDPRAGEHRRRSGDGRGARLGREGRRRVRCDATTCGRRRGSTWSTTASRAS